MALGRNKRDRGLNGSLSPFSLVLSLSDLLTEKSRFIRSFFVFFATTTERHEPTTTGRWGQRQLMTRPVLLLVFGAAIVEQFALAALGACLDMTDAGNNERDYLPICNQGQRLKVSEIESNGSNATKGYPDHFVQRGLMNVMELHPIDITLIQRTQHDVHGGLLLSHDVKHHKLNVGSMQ